MRIVELSHELDMPVVESLSMIDSARLLEGKTVKPDASVDWHVYHMLLMSSHRGTHIESPYHWKRNGKDISQLAIENLIGDAVVLDLSRVMPMQKISLDDMRSSAGQELRKGDMVFVRTDFSRHWGTETYWESNPYFDTEALDWLVNNGASLLGVDLPRIEDPKATGEERYVNHQAVLGRDVPVIENMTNLQAIARSRVLALILPLRVKNLDSWPVRVVAIEKEVGEQL